MQLSELRPDAVKLILRLVLSAKGRMNLESEGGNQTTISDTGEPKGSVKLGKTPIHSAHHFNHD